MGELLWTLFGLAGVGGLGWLLGFTRGIRQSAHKIGEQSARLEVLERLVESMEERLRDASAPPLPHHDAGRVLREVSATGDMGGVPPSEPA